MEVILVAVAIVLFFLLLPVVMFALFVVIDIFQDYTHLLFKFIERAWSKNE